MRTAAIAELEWLDQQGYPTAQALKDLSQFGDDGEHALSFYFGIDHVSDKSHHEVVTSVSHWIEHIVGPAAARGEKPTDVLRDLISVRDRIIANPHAFHIVLSCPTALVRLETSLPASLNLQTAGVGYRFNLAPLAAAIEKCTPYLAVVIESDKARAFAVRGTEAHELVGALTQADLRTHPDDSRVGWSHHVEGNVDARARSYWKRLSLEITNLAKELDIHHLAIGCRDALWGHIKEAFVGMQGIPFRQFPLRSFEAAPHEVLEDSQASFEMLRKERYEAFDREWQENPRQRTAGVEDTLLALEQGLVRTLLIGASLSGDTMECSHCGKWQQLVTGRCVHCQGKLHLVPLDGLLVRKALLSGAEILMLSGNSADQLGIRATLRFEVLT